VLSIGVCYWGVALVKVDGAVLGGEVGGIARVHISRDGLRVASLAYHRLLKGIEGLSTENFVYFAIHVEKRSRRYHSDLVPGGRAKE